MFRSKLLKFFALAVSLLVLAGCGSSSSDKAVVTDRFKKIVSTPDPEEFVRYVTDPFTVTFVTVDNGIEDPSEPIDIYRHEMLPENPEDLPLALPILGFDEEVEIEGAVFKVEYQDIIVNISGHKAIARQQVKFTALEEQRAVGLTVSTEWSKASGQWLMVALDLRVSWVD